MSQVDYAQGILLKLLAIPANYTPQESQHGHMFERIMLSNRGSEKQRRLIQQLGPSDSIPPWL
jgi:hypothetical protein